MAATQSYRDNALTVFVAGVDGSPAIATEAVVSDIAAVCYFFMGF